VAKRGFSLCFVLLALLLRSDLAVAANADLNHAYQTFQQGQFSQALQQWQTILPELKSPERIDTLLHMAEAYQALGQIREAFTALEEAHTLAEGSGDKARQALVLGSLSDNYSAPI
jgi:Tfp pilus assembly protein PilF